MIIIKKFINKLLALFDYQRFENNDELGKVIDKTDKALDNGSLLADDQLAFVGGGFDAAGIDVKFMNGVITQCPYTKQDCLYGGCQHYKKIENEEYCLNKEVIQK